LGGVAALALLLIAVLLLAGNTAAGRAMIERVTFTLTGGHVQLVGLGGSFPTEPTLSQLRLIDRGGVWLSADHIALRWSPWALLERRIAVDDLEVARLDMERLPLSEPSSGGPVSVPHIDVARFSIDVLELGAGLAGRPATLSVRGGGRMRSLEDASADVVAHRTDNDGEYTLHFKFDRSRMDGTLEVHEPASGPLENILQLPGLGALSANLRVAGPHNAERVDLTLQAGDLSARLDGSVDLQKASADLDYSLQAPEMSPRPDIRWRRIALNGRWHGTFSDPTADGSLQIDGLRLPGGTEIAALSAQLKAGAGNLAMHGVVGGLRIPGPQPALLANDPVNIDASMRVSEAKRPLVVAATHRLFSLEAQAITAGRQSIVLDLRLPDVAPFAALAGQQVRGDATLKAQIDQRGADWDVNLDADAGIGRGSAAWLGVLGSRVALKLSAALSEQAVAIERLQLSGRAWTLSASASAARPKSGASQPHAVVDDYITDVKARWDLRIADLGILAPELTGALQASGQVSGAPSSLAADAALKSTLSLRGSPPGTVSAEVHAKGLPSAPTATVKVGGTLDGSPLVLAVALEKSARAGVRASIQHAEWKSAHAEGELAMKSSIAEARGEIRLSVGELGDVDRLLGTHLKGNVDGAIRFTPKDGRTEAQFRVDGRELIAGGFSGALQLTGEGSTDSVSAQLKVQAPEVRGAPANLTASALLDFDTREIRIVAASADYAGQGARLLSPAVLSFQHGFKVDKLRLGMQDAVLQIEGELAPSLDLSASLQHVGPKLIEAFLPDVVSAGTIEAHAHLLGSISAPTGAVDLEAHGFRFTSDEAVGLPPLDLDAKAQLAGDDASVDVRLHANGASLLTATGGVPLNPAGAYDLKILGKMDVAAVNALFEARGMHAGGELAVDATLGGSLIAPQIRGTVTLAKGNLRDYVRGINLTDINAEVFGSEGTLQIKSFKATAASGTVNVTGSIGALQPGIPVDLKITAARAQPINSSIVTANLDANLQVSGTARERLAVTGTIHINRATIGIPDSLPPDVAVLDVRRRGKAPPPAGKRLEIVFDVTIQAPQEILVQGRGLDAELGGELHIGGTAAAPLVTGGFDLQRGSFTIASSKLTLTQPGRVSFDGAGLKKNIDPTLDFTAQTSVNSVTATLRITGYADAPKFEFTSSAGQAPDEIMALLLFGENPTQLTALQLAQVGAALATLSGVGGSGSNPLTKLQRTLGLDRLSVGAGTTTTATGATENSGAAIQAGRYISKRVYVEGRQSSTGQSQVAVEVDLTKHLKLQTRLGNGTAIQGTTPENDPGSSVGLSYQFEY
jgi:translocation and assembly module TamB